MKEHHHINRFKQNALHLLVLGAMLVCTPGFTDSYTVKKGDTLSGIAKKHGIRAADIQAANNVGNVNRLQIGQKLVIPNPDAPLKYTVRPGDTLDRIARKHHSTIAVLKSYNHLKNANSLSIGQTILIPGGEIASAVRSTAAHPLLPASFRRDLNRIPVKKGNWRYIVIHHSASDSGTVAGMDRYHREERRMKNGLAYHFVIGNGKGMRDGEVAIGDRWKKQIQGGHLASEALNRVAIGICLVGNFEKRTPSAAQMKSLEALLADLLNRTHLQPGAVRTHRAINNRPTRCPGRRFPIALVQSKL